MVSKILLLSCGEDGIASMRSDHSRRRSASRASRKLGVFFCRYQGLVSQVPSLGWVRAGGLVWITGRTHW